MKFDLTEKDVRLVDGKFVQLPMKRFVALTEYVENLESRLLSAEVNLRESARVGRGMETMPGACSIKESDGREKHLRETACDPHRNSLRHALPLRARRVHTHARCQKYLADAEQAQEASLATECCCERVQGTAVSYVG